MRKEEKREKRKKENERRARERQGTRRAPTRSKITGGSSECVSPKALFLRSTSRPEQNVVFICFSEPNLPSPLPLYPYLPLVSPILLSFPPFAPSYPPFPLSISSSLFPFSFNLLHFFFLLTTPRQLSPVNHAITAVIARARSTRGWKLFIYLFGYL